MQKFLLTIYNPGYGKIERMVTAESYNAAHHLYVADVAPGRFVSLEPLETIPIRNAMRDWRLMGGRAGTFPEHIQQGIDHGDFG